MSWLPVRPEGHITPGPPRPLVRPLVLVPVVTNQLRTMRRLHADA